MDVAAAVAVAVLLWLWPLPGAVDFFFAFKLSQQHRAVFWRCSGCRSLGCDATELKFLATRVECQWAGASPVVLVMKGYAMCGSRPWLLLVARGGGGILEVRPLWKFEFRRG